MKNRDSFFISVYSRSFYLSYKKRTKKILKDNYLLALILREIFIKKNNQSIFDVLRIQKIDKSKEVINNLFKDILNQNWINLFSIMIDDKIIHLFIPVLKRIILFFERFLNVKHVEIYSVIKLNKIQINEIEIKISKILNKEVKLSNYLDNNLIGGVMVQVGDYRWDNSIKTKFEKLQKELFEN